MLVNYTKHPLMLVMYLSALLLIVGGFLKWIVLPEGSLAETAGGELIQTKQYVAIGVGVIALIVGFFVAQKASKGLSVLNIILSVVAFVAVITAYISPDEAAQLGLKPMEVGFYLALVGVVVLFITSLAAVFVLKKMH